MLLPNVFNFSKSACHYASDWIMCIQKSAFKVVHENCDFVFEQNVRIDAIKQSTRSATSYGTNQAGRNLSIS